MKNFQKGEMVTVRCHKMKVVNHNAPLVYLVELTDMQCEVGTSVEYDRDVERLPAPTGVTFKECIDWLSGAM